MAAPVTASALPTSFSGSTTSPNTAMDALFAGGEGAATQVTESTPPSGDLGDLGSLGDLPPEQGETSPSASEPGSSTEPKGEPNWIEFSVTDEQGRRKMKVDLNDRAKLERLLPQAAGFRKMQAERDSEKAWRKTAEPRLTELEGNWQTLEAAYSEGGVEGLVDLLGGKKGHFAEWKSQEFEKEARFRGASEAEKRAMALEEQVTRLEKQNQLREKRVQEEAKKASTDRESAELRSVEAQITPVFNKHRFAGTLGNAQQEAAFDKAIWDQALANLEALPEDQPLTAQVIDKEFRTVSAAFKAAIGKAGNQRAKSIVDGKKAAAGANVAAAATRGVAPQKAGTMDSMAANVRRGGVSGLTAGLMDILNMKR